MFRQKLGGRAASKPGSTRVLDAALTHAFNEFYST
jgi:hypothetical protein